jgi:tetratricopeptide (TPR) repeat protein
VQEQYPIDKIDWLVRWAPWCVGLFALMIRCFYLWSFWASNPFSQKLISDARIYDDWAQRIAGGDWLGGSEVFSLPPLYPYLVGVFYAAFGYGPHTVVVLQALAGCVSAMLVCRLGGRHFGLWPGCVAGVLFAVYGPQLFFEGMLLGNAGAVFLCLVGITFLDEGVVQMPKSNWQAGLAGFVFGLAVLMRPNVLAVIPFLLLGIWWVTRKVGINKFGVQFAGWFMLFLAVPLFICGLRNGLVSDDWVLVTAHGGINFYMGNHEGAPGWFSAPEGVDAQITPDGVQGNLEGPRRVAEAALGRSLNASEVSDYWFQKGWNFWVHHPLNALLVTAHKIRLFVSGYEVPLNYNFYYQRQFSRLLQIPVTELWVIFPLAFLGMFVAIKNFDRHALLYLWGVGYALGVIMFHVSSRYRMPVIPILMVFAGYGVWTFYVWIQTKNWKSVWIAGGALVVLWVGYRADLNGWVKQSDLGGDAFNLGTSYLWENDNEKALAFFKEAEAYRPKDGARYYNLGLAYARLGHVAEAKTAYETALIYSPNKMEIYVNLGNMLFREKEYEEAIAMYLKALTREPLAHNARANMGWALLALGRVQEARAAWDAVLEMVPNHPSAEAGRKRLGM